MILYLSMHQPSFHHWILDMDAGSLADDAKLLKKDIRSIQQFQENMENLLGQIAEIRSMISQLSAVVKRKIRV